MKTRLKEVRKAAGYSQQEASTVFKVSIGTYRNWEQGRVVMNGEQLISAAHVFNTTVDYILMTDRPNEEEQAPEDELLALYHSMDVAGRDALIIVARGLSLTFPDERKE